MQDKTFAAYESDKWPRDFDFRVEVAEQKELLEAQHCSINAELAEPQSVSQARDDSACEKLD